LNPKLTTINQVAEIQLTPKKREPNYIKTLNRNRMKENNYNKKKLITTVRFHTTSAPNKA
jgi:hypothetical protein